jgi:hypothetical protein
MTMTVSRSLISIYLLVAAVACVPPQGAGAEEPGGGFAQERVHEEAQVKIWIPARWSVDDTQADMLVLMDPDEEVGIMFMVVEAEDLAGALVGITTGILTEVDEIQLQGDPEALTINGMDALVADGIGTLDGTPIELSVGVLLTPTDKFLLVVGMADSAALHRHEATVLEIFQRLEPYRG